MHLDQMEKEKLLKDRRVIEEINRHLWIESEKAGYDIGFDKAKEDWLINFSKAWMHYHYPSQTASSRQKSNRKVSQKSATRRRRAKSYIR